MSVQIPKVPVHTFKQLMGGFSALKVANADVQQMCDQVKFLHGSSDNINISEGCSCSHLGMRL